MPTNLPPEYYSIEEQYRTASSNEERVALLEEMMSVIPKHKGTDHLRADIRRRIAKLKEAGQTRKTSRQTSAFHIEKEGAGQVAVVGWPNVGKSALVTALTNASPEVSPAPFSTWAPTPGMVPIDNIQVQLIDTPPLNFDFIEPELPNLLRRVDLLLIMVDMQTNPLQQLDDTVALLDQYRIVSPRWQHRSDDPRRLTVKPMIVLANKADDDRFDDDFEALRELEGDDWPMLAISVATGRNLEHLKWVIYEALDIMRVYARPPGREPDFTAPFVLKHGATVEEFAAMVHKDFVEHLRSARIWGRDVFDGQLVGRDHVLHEGDIVELRA